MILVFEKIKEFCSNHHCYECPFEKDSCCVICSCAPMEWDIDAIQEAIKAMEEGEKSGK